MSPHTVNATSIHSTVQQQTTTVVDLIQSPCMPTSNSLSAIDLIETPAVSLLGATSRFCYLSSAKWDNSIDVTGFDKTRLRRTELLVEIWRFSSIYCIVASWWIMLKKWKLQQVLVYSLAIILWVNNFQTTEIQVVLSSFFRDGNDIAGGSNRGGGWRVGLIRVQNGIRRQMKARGSVWGPTGPLLCSQHSKLKITDIGQPFVASKHQYKRAMTV